MSEQQPSCILTISCPDTVGIVAEVTGFLRDGGYFIEESAHFGDRETRQFFSRIRFKASQGNWSRSPRTRASRCITATVRGRSGSGLARWNCRGGSPINGWSRPVSLRCIPAKILDPRRPIAGGVNEQSVSAWKTLWIAQSYSAES